MYQNLKTLIASPARILSYLILMLLAASLWWYMTDILIMFGNYGDLHTYTDIILSIMMIVIFPLFLVALFYKSWTYGKRADIVSKTTAGMIGGIFTTILAYITILLLIWFLWWAIAMIIIYGSFSLFILISLLMMLIFLIFLVALFYKKWIYGTQADIDTKTTTGIIGGIIGTILSGCSCCGLTFAASFGLLPLMSVLPYNGIEIKLVGALGLLYATWDILSNLETCKVKR